MEPGSGKKYDLDDGDDGADSTDDEDDEIGTICPVS